MAEKKLDAAEEQAEQDRRAQRGAPDPAFHTVVSTTGAKAKVRRDTLPIEQTSAEYEELRGDAGESIVRAQERGHHGFVPDPTPNSHYTFAGRAADLPTPETDGRLAAVASARTTLPASVPFVPSNQEQFENLMEYKAEATGTDTAPVKSE